MGSLRFEGLTTLPLPCILQYVDMLANTIIDHDQVVKNRFEWKLYLLRSLESLSGLWFDFLPKNRAFHSRPCTASNFSIDIETQLVAPHAILLRPHHHVFLGCSPTYKSKAQPPAIHQVTGISEKFS